MLSDTKPDRVTGVSGTADDSRILSLAETVGNMGHWYWHIQSNVMTWSDQVFQIFGRDPASFSPTFHLFLEAVHPDDRARVRSTFELGDASASFELDARIIAPSGAIRNVIAKGQPETDELGQVVAVFGVFTDVTEAFKTLEAVRDQKEMLDLAARVSGLGHWVWDPDHGNVTFCSEHLGILFDTDADHLLSVVNHPSEFSAFIDIKDRVSYETIVKRSLSLGLSYEVNYQSHSAAGTKHLREIGEPVFDDDGTLRRYVATVLDVTETKKREAELERARHELEALVEAKDQLFSIIGHDLKSPFNNIIGFASLLSGSTISLSPDKVQEYAALILEAAENTNALLDTLLAWAAVESSDLPYRPVEVSLADAFNDSVRPLNTLAREKGVKIETAFKDVKVHADRDMVLTVFRNLINNAIKFCEANDVISVSARPSEESSANVRVTVSDTGIGMDSSKITAFLDGRRLETTAGTGGETGSGLGLRICHNLVRRQRGNLWVESSPGKGCQVHFELPAA